MSLAWPDIVIGAVLILGALKGFKRGFIAELTGFVALFFGIAQRSSIRGTGTVSRAIGSISVPGPPTSSR